MATQAILDIKISPLSVLFLSWDLGSSTILNSISHVYLCASFNIVISYNISPNDGLATKSLALAFNSFQLHLIKMPQKNQKPSLLHI